MSERDNAPQEHTTSYIRSILWYLSDVKGFRALNLQLSGCTQHSGISGIMETKICLFCGSALINTVLDSLLLDMRARKRVCLAECGPRWSLRSCKLVGHCYADACRGMQLCLHGIFTSNRNCPKPAQEAPLSWVDLVNCGWCIKLSLCTKQLHKTSAWRRCSLATSSLAPHL